MENALKTSNWFSDLEDQKPLVVFAVALVCAALIAFSSLRNPADYDGWWHLKMGADLIEQGLSPYVDHYSYTYAGEEIRGVPVAFQVTYYYLNRLLGDHGGQVAIKMLAFLLCLSLMLVWLRQLRAPVVVYVLILPLLVGALQFRMQVRPEMFSYALCVLAFILYRRTNLQLGFREIAPVALLLLIWVNYHSPMFGYVIFFGLFIDIALRLVRKKAGLKAWTAWAAWGVVLTAIGFLNPDLSHSVLATLSLSSEWKTHITEYFPPVFKFGMLSLYPLILSAIAALVLCVAQRRVGYLLILLVFIYYATTIARMLGPSFLIILIILADLLSRARIWDQIPNLSPGSRRALGMGIIGVIVASILINVLVARSFLSENRVSWGMFPNPMVLYMKDQGITGNLFHPFELGGFFLYRLSPEVKVYIDGRTNILYPLEHFLNFDKALKNTDLFLEVADKYDIEYSVFQNNPAAERLTSDAGFALEYADSRYSLYRKGTGKLALLGKISVQPYCWPLAESRSLEEEIRFALGGGLADSGYVIPLAAVTSFWLRTDDKQSFFQNFNTSILETDPSRRFFAYRALEHGLPEAAAAQLLAIERRLPKDELATMLALLQSGNLGLANTRMEQSLNELKDWINVDFIDLVILRALIDEISTKTSMPYLNPELDAELNMVLGDQTLKNRGIALSSSVFCTSSP